MCVCLAVLAHISRQLAVTEGGVECSSPLQFSSRNQLENDDSVVIGREYALPMLSSEGILRGNLRPSEVLAISSLGKKDGRVLSSVRGCVGGDGGKRESDDVLLGSSSEDYDESEENEEGGGGDEDGGEEGWSTGESYHAQGYVYITLPVQMVTLKRVSVWHPEEQLSDWWCSCRD